MPGDRSDFAAALIERGRRTPERLAFGFGDARLSYGELLDDASRIAAGLRAVGERHGPETVMHYGGGGQGNHLLGAYGAALRQALGACRRAARRSHALRL